jgi:molybdenum ABC transporter molybdate-binding protein
MSANGIKIAVASGAAVAAAGLPLTAAPVDADNAATTLVAFVAANATDPFNDIVKEFEASHADVDVTPEYAGTQVLETQLEQGAPADLFLSADLDHIKKLQGEGLVGEYYPVSMGHEVIVVPKDNPARVQSLQDLGTKQLKLVIGVEDVPIGKYTRQVFAKAAAGYGAGFPQAAFKNVVSLESNVKQILEQVALGEADAGIVYRTDVTPGYASKVDVVEIPAEYEVESTNYIAVVVKSQNARLATALVQLAIGPEGQAVFARYGYDKLP